MVETLIVSVFVLTIFVLIYQNSIPMVGAYKNRERYDDADSVYNANLFRNLLLKDGLLYQQVTNEVAKQGYMDLTNCGVFTNEFLETCNDLKEMIGVTSEDKIYITNWDIGVKGTETNKNLLQLSSLNRGLLEYVKYIEEQEQETSMYDYRLILSRTVYHVYEELVGEGEDATVVEEDKASTYYVNIGV